MMKPLDRQPKFPALEEAMLKSWNEEKVFEQSLEKNREGKPFVFLKGRQRRMAARGSIISLDAR